VGSLFRAYSQPASATAVPIAGDVLVGIAPRTLGVSRRTSFVDLFDRPWVLNPDGCGYRTLLGALAASLQRSIHVVAEVQGASLQRELCRARDRPRASGSRARLDVPAAERKRSHHCQAERHAVCHHRGADLNRDNPASWSTY
jgi:hypothetical protein